MTLLAVVAVTLDLAEDQRRICAIKTLIKAKICLRFDKTAVKNSRSTEKKKKTRIESSVGFQVFINSDCMWIKQFPPEKNT
jgi:hypothetical protein